MRHRWDVYRGRRAGSGRLPSILLTLAMLLSIAFVAVFFALPSYLVYTKDSVSLELPGITVGEEAIGSPSPHSLKSPITNTRSAFGAQTRNTKPVSTECTPI